MPRRLSTAFGRQLTQGDAMAQWGIPEYGREEVLEIAAPYATRAQLARTT
jgi:hypothetical protein